MCHDPSNLPLSRRSPTPKVKWMKMGEKMPPRAKYLNYGKLLTLSAAQEGDDGKYMCTATNSAGEDVHYFDVIVEGEPAAGSNCALTCALRPSHLLSEWLHAEVQVVFSFFFFVFGLTSS